MPSPSSTSSSKPRNPLAAVWLFALTVVLLEAALTLGPDNDLVRFFHARALPTKPFTWQVMGDSVAYGGIVATQLSATLPPGQTVCNLALPGSGPGFPYFQLKREIAAGLAPKAILYAPSPHTFATTRVPVIVGGFCTWPEVAEVGATGIKPYDVLYGVLCKISYTLRYRDEIAAMLKHTGPTEAVADSESDSFSLPKDASHPRFTPENLNPTYKRPFIVDPFDDCFLQKFLALAAANQIPVYWMTLPVLPAVYESRKKYDFEPDYLRFLAGLEQEGKIHVLQGNFPVWNEIYFKDSSHLTTEGARRLTGVVAEKLADLEKNATSTPWPKR